MERKEQILKIFEDIDNKPLIEKLIDDMVFIEEQLIELRKLPMISVHPTNPQLQKATPSAKLYKENLQQYNNIIRTLSAFIRHDDTVESSPLEAFLEGLNSGK